MGNQRNMILAILLSGLVLLGWTWATSHWFPVANAPATRIEGGKTTDLPAPNAPSAATVRDRQAVLRESSRIAIRTPRLSGSINLTGARLDDLLLLNYRETVDKASPPIRLLSPEGAPKAYFAGFGWSSPMAGAQLPGPRTPWLADGDALTPDKPLTLKWTNPLGQTFLLRFTVDKDYLFSVEQAVVNAGGAPLPVKSFGFVTRDEPSPDLSSWTMHIGPLGVFNGAADFGMNYSDIDAAGSRVGAESTKGGWLGFGDKYWLTAMIPDAGQTVGTRFAGNGQVYQADFTAPETTVAPGQTLTQRARFFAGAKEVGILDRYQAQAGVEMLSYAIDWGWFRIVEKPLFYYLDLLHRWIGNFGVAIILLTVTVKLALFPLAQAGFRSMARMRVVQPKMKAIQERYADDRPKMQQEMMALYKTEKISPMSGCLPMLLQAPIFYALYKVLIVAVELRHQPFALWIKDLSAPDPLTPINLFGLLNFTPPHMLAIGVVPIVLGITMYLQFKLNPQAMDPIQQKMFAIMPWVLMVIMAPFAVGLQIYWITSNIWSIIQQKILYAQHPEMKQATPLPSFLSPKGLANKEPAQATDVTPRPAPAPKAPSPSKPARGTPRGKGKQP